MEWKKIYSSNMESVIDDVPFLNIRIGTVTDDAFSDLMRSIRKHRAFLFEVLDLILYYIPLNNVQKSEERKQLEPGKSLKKKD